MTDQLFNVPAEPPPPTRVVEPAGPRGVYPEYDALCDRTTAEVPMWVPSQATTKFYNEAHWREVHWWYLRQLWHDIDAGDPSVPVQNRCTAVYHAHAVAAQLLAIKLRIQAWGTPRQVGHAKADPRLDAGFTNLRQFIMCPRVFARWQLLIIECWLCDVNGYPYPRGAYTSEMGLEDAPPPRPVPLPQRVPRPRPQADSPYDRGG